MHCHTDGNEYKRCSQFPLSLSLSGLFPAYLTTNEINLFLKYLLMLIRAVTEHVIPTRGIQCLFGDASKLNWRCKLPRVIAHCQDGVPSNSLADSSLSLAILNQSLQMKLGQYLNIAPDRPIHHPPLTVITFHSIRCCTPSTDEKRWLGTV